MEETWLPVKGYEGLYSVSSDGRVRGEDKFRDRGRGITAKVSGRILKPYNGKNYKSVSLVKNGKKKTVNIHTIVADAFLGDRLEGECVCHRNGDSYDNSVLNLRYATQAENIKDKERHGTKKQGEGHYKSILTENDVNFILAMRGKMTCKELGKRFGVSVSTISKINTGKNWKCLSL